MMEELARRAIACDRWRWLPGMLALDTGLRLDEVTDDWEAELPDLEDPATLGCLLALVREAWGDPCLHIGLLPARWGVWTSQNMPLHECVGKGLTEAEALVAALEAAP